MEDEQHSNLREEEKKEQNDSVVSQDTFPIYIYGQEVIPKSHWFRAGMSITKGSNKSGGEDLFIFGGYDGPNDLYILRNAQDLPEGTNSYWEKVDIKCQGRAAHISFYRDNKLYIQGGYDNNDRVFYDMFEIDLNSETFATKNISFASVHIDIQRRWHCFYFNSDADKLFIHAGWNRSGPLNDLSMFSFKTSKWEKLEFQGQPSPRRWHTLNQIPNKLHQLIVYGGYNGDCKKPLDDMHLLDLEKQTWIEIDQVNKGKPPIPGRCRHSFTPIDDSGKQLLLLGGYGNNLHETKEAFIFHLDDHSWSTFPNCGPFYPICRSAHKVERIGEFGLFIGGGYVNSFLEPFYYADLRMFQ